MGPRITFNGGPSFKITRYQRLHTLRFGRLANRFRLRAHLWRQMFFDGRVDMTQGLIRMV